MLTAALAGRSAQAAVPDNCAPAITPESFQRYIDAFNRADEAVYGEYYHPEVTLVLGGNRELKGKAAIASKQRQLHRPARTAHARQPQTQNRQP